jgi:CBS domain-containing protein
MLKTQHVMIKNVVTTKRDITVRKAIEVLFKRHVGAIVVIDDKKKCVGIFTERDAIRVVAQNIPLDATSLGKVMTKNVVTVSEDTTFDESRRLLISHGIRHLPVVNSQDKVVGLVVLRHFLDELFGMCS